LRPAFSLHITSPESDLAAEDTAVLVLADGSVFRGCGIGADGQTVGEVVFNTAMTGYQEILTDPSYAGQIVTLTYPHIGNVGTNGEDAESRSVYAAGLIIRDLPLESSSWRQEEDLSTYLRRNALVAIGDIDTRGSRACCAARRPERLPPVRADRREGGLGRRPRGAVHGGQDLAKVVSAKAAYDWNGSLWALGTGYKDDGEARFHVVAYDYGVKHNILRNLSERGCKVTVLPATATAKDALALAPTASSSPTAPAIPSPATTRSRRSARSSAPARPSSASASGTSCLGLRRARRP
jgi:carbamoyl-phosphate synthase small subunit